MQTLSSDLVFRSRVGIQVNLIELFPRPQFEIWTPPGKCPSSHNYGGLQFFLRSSGLVREAVESSLPSLVTAPLSAFPHGLCSPSSPLSIILIVSMSVFCQCAAWQKESCQLSLNCSQLFPLFSQLFNTAALFSLLMGLGPSLKGKIA